MTRVERKEDAGGKKKKETNEADFPKKRRRTCTKEGSAPLRRRKRSAPKRKTTRGVVYLAALVVSDTAHVRVPFLLLPRSRDSEAHPSSAGGAAFTRVPSQPTIRKVDEKQLHTRSVGYTRSRVCYLRGETDQPTGTSNDSCGRERCLKSSHTLFTLFSLFASRSYASRNIRARARAGSLVLSRSI